MIHAKWQGSLSQSNGSFKVGKNGLSFLCNEFEVSRFTLIDVNLGRTGRLAQLFKHRTEDGGVEMCQIVTHQGDGYSLAEITCWFEFNLLFNSFGARELKYHLRLQVGSP